MNVKLKFLISLISVFSVVTLAVCFVSIVCNKNGEITPPVSLRDDVYSYNSRSVDESVWDTSSYVSSNSSEDDLSDSSAPANSSSLSKPENPSNPGSSSKPQSSSQKPQSSSSSPQSSSTPEVKDDYEHIMGQSVLTAEQMVSYVIKNQGGSTSNIKLTCSLYELATYYLEEGKAEGVRGEIAFMQGIVETGWFTYPSSGSVTYDQNNFCGLGVTGKIDPATGQKVKGEYFENARIGVRAQIQHLKAYAVDEDLKNACVDNRYEYIKPRGKAGNLWTGLNMSWSMTKDYSVKILAKYQEAKATVVNPTYVALSKVKKS